jgi:GTP-binding protein
MRREGFELQLSRPEVIFKEIDGVKCEPYEEVHIEVPDEYSGVVIEKLNQRYGILKNLENLPSGAVRIMYRIPSRGLLGYRGQFLTDTKGEGILYSIFDSYDKIAGSIKARRSGSIVSQEEGKAVAFALFNIQERGSLFIKPNDSIYEGMVIGIYSKQSDLVVNPMKKKQLTNMRASGSDEAVRLVPPIDMTLEKAMEFIDDDELIEITPLSIRVRKKLLTFEERKRFNKHQES